MCLIAVAYNHFPGHRLVMLANRDEFHDRPALPAHWWSDHPILAGRDQRAGGTWLGVSRSGRLATVTNYREIPPEAGERSRGDLPVAFLASNNGAAEHATDLIDEGHHYGGCNLLMFDGRSLCWSSNRASEWLTLKDGVHALSNHLLNTEWPKVKRLKTELEGMGQLDVDACLALLNDREGAADDDLPDTGIGLEGERLLAPIHIISERYGTRCSTVVAINENGAIAFTEVSYDRAGEIIGRVDFALPAADPHVTAETLDPDQS